MAGENAKENFKIKLGKDETIFSKQITDGMDVRDYKMIYCNYFVDLNYGEYIPDKYLPIGVDATYDNAYRIKKLKD